MTEPCEFAAGLCIHCGDATQSDCEGWNAPSDQISALTARVAELESERDQLKTKNEKLVVVLNCYAEESNWDQDDYGVKRLWLEPDSNARDAYEGHEMAQKALKENP